MMPLRVNTHSLIKANSNNLLLTQKNQTCVNSKKNDYVLVLKTV